MLTEKELIDKMDSMSGGKKCRDCDEVFDMESWEALTPTKKEYIRKDLNFYIKPKIMAGGQTGYTVDCRCKRCKYLHEKSRRFRGRGNGQGGKGLPVSHVGPEKGTPEHLFFCGLKP